MKECLLAILKCPCCGGQHFSSHSTAELYNEWRQGSIECMDCGRFFSLDDGIVDFLVEPSPEIVKEREGAHSTVRIKTRDGEKFTVNPESIEQFADLFMSLPQGDGSYFFKAGGSFDTFSFSAHRFYELLKQMDLITGTKVLEIGAGLCWASREFAKWGCEVVAVDIVNHMKVADLYLRDGLFFERVYADMNRLPFKDDTFDKVFAAAALHHSSDLEKTFKEFNRVLRKNGELILINECFIGIFEKPRQHPEGFAYNDQYHSVPYWQTKLKKGGFRKIRIIYLSVFKDYIARKTIRGAKNSWKLYLSKKIVAHPFFDNVIAIMSIPNRILFRPRSILIRVKKR